MNLDDYSYEFEDRRYINPQVSLDEQNAFIDNLRNAQAQDTDQIIQQTKGLGTPVASSQGGLAGGSGYFKSRYQTPQTNQAIADLKAAAQSQALSDVINNEIAKVQKRYKDAYRAAQERASNNNKTITGGDGDETTGQYMFNYDGTDKEASSFWKTGRIDDDYAYFGDQTLKRNDGESDNDWYQRALAWGKGLSAEKNAGQPVNKDLYDLDD